MNPSKNKQSLTSFQLFNVIFSSMLGFGALTISRYAATQVGRDGWMSVLLGGMIIVINSLIILKLNKRFPGKTIVQYSQDVLGKFAGKIVSLIFVGSSISIAGLMISFTAFVINSWILIDTPPYVIYGTMLFVCAFVCLKDLKVLGRVVVLLFFFHLGFFLLFVPPVLQSGHFMNILPIAGSGPMNILNGVAPCIYAFAGYEVITIFYAFADDQKKSAKWTIASVVVMAFVYTFAVATQIMVFPLDYLKKLWLPSMNFIGIISVPFIERLDVVFIISWLYVFFKVVSIYYYAATIEIQQIFNIKNRNSICYSIAPLIFLVALFSGSTKQMDQFTYFATSFTVLVSLIVPIILLILSVLLKKGEHQ